MSVGRPAGGGTVRSVDGASPPPGPPADPEDWSDEQWLEWLAAQDDADGEEPDRARPPARLQRSRGGQLLGNAMLGVANAIYGHPQDDEVVAVAPAGEPDDDQPFQVVLDPDRPERSRVVFRRRR